MSRSSVREDEWSLWLPVNRQRLRILHGPLPSTESALRGNPVDGADYFVPVDVCLERNIMTVSANLVEQNYATASKMLRLREVLQLIPVSRSTFYAGMAKGRFPAAVKSGRISLWRSQDIAKWIADPANASFDIPAEVCRLAERSAVFADDIGSMADLSRDMEAIALAILMQAFASKAEQVAPNEYDRSCLDRVRARHRALTKSGKPSLDLMGYWRPK